VDARRFNAALVNTGQAAFRLADAVRIPTADASLDRVLAINVIYFWSDPVVPLREIRRVLRPSGVSLITAVTPETVAGNETYRVENGFHARDADTLVALHRQAGFGEVWTELVTEVASRVDGTPWTRHYNFLQPGHDAGRHTVYGMARPSTHRQGPSRDWGCHAAFADRSARSE
jgi:SAM-dependent methyltransferase